MKLTTFRLADKSIEKDASRLRVLLGQGATSLSTMPSDGCWLHCADTENTYGGSNAAANLQTGGAGGNYNTALGWGAMRYNATGDENVAIGAEAMEGTSTKSPTGIVAVGFQAMHGVASNGLCNNVAIGHKAGYTDGGYSNVLIGHEVGYLLQSTAYENVIIGNHAADTATALSTCTIVGGSAGQALASSESNETYIGYSAGGYAKICIYNTYLGAYAGNRNIGSAAPYDPALENVCVGYQAGYGNSSTLSRYSGCVYIGFNSAYHAQDHPDYNVAIGWNALHENREGDGNVAIGAEAARGASNTSPAYNTAIGYQALHDVSTGTYNVSLGWTAGDLITTGTYNICIGPGMDPPANNSNYRINIGDAIFGDWAANIKTVGINRAAIAAQLDVYQDQAAGALPVLKLEQKDVSEEFIRLVGTAADNLTQSLVNVDDARYIGLEGFFKVYIQDDGDQITDGTYYVPFYSVAYST